MCAYRLGWVEGTTSSPTWRDPDTDRIWDASSQLLVEQLGLDPESAHDSYSGQESRFQLTNRAYTPRTPCPQPAPSNKSRPGTGTVWPQRGQPWSRNGPVAWLVTDMSTPFPGTPGRLWKAPLRPTSAHHDSKFNETQAIDKWRLSKTKCNIFVFFFPLKSHLVFSWQVKPSFVGERERERERESMAVLELSKVW